LNVEKQIFITVVRRAFQKCISLMFHIRVFPKNLFYKNFAF